MEHESGIRGLAEVEAKLDHAVAWVLLFGGSTPAGAARARRVHSHFSGSTLVVWFDGFGVSASVEPTTSNAVLDFSEATEPGWWRLVGDPSRHPRRVPTKLERRIRNLIRPFATWRALRPTLQALAARPAPDAIVYCDDVAVPLAWHAARVWPGAPLVAGVPET